MKDNELTRFEAMRRAELEAANPSDPTLIIEYRSLEDGTTRIHYFLSSDWDRIVKETECLVASGELDPEECLWESRIVGIAD